jgi:broad specificity phosphatase PhoE
MGGNSSQLVKPGPALDDNRLVVELISASNVPKLDITSESDPFARMYLTTARPRSAADKRKQSKQHSADKGVTCSTLYRIDTANPVWHTFQDLEVEADGTDILNVCIYDYDSSNFGHDMAGALRIPVSELTAEPKVFPIVESKHNDFGDQKPNKAAAAAGMTVTLRRVQPPFVKRKRLFLVRHGESKWNKATHDKNVVDMLDYDHGLNEQGVQQARDLNQRWKKVLAERNATDDDEKEHDADRVEGFMRAFFGADHVFASPLTRATETALVSLFGHPRLNEKGLTLLRTFREVKNFSFGSLDTVGKAIGDAIRQRVLEELQAVDNVTDDEAKQFMVPMDVHDAGTEWWTRTEDQDSKEEIENRLLDFLNTVRYTPGESIIAVGHSLFSRELCRRFQSTEFAKANPAIAKLMRKKKLNNGACLALEMDFSGSRPRILDAELMFGSSFHK